MTKQEILSELERRIGRLDENARQAVSAALDLAASTAATPVEPAPSPEALAWQGENPPFEEMAKLDMDERSRVMQALEDRNRLWLEQKLKELRARWMFVIDGEVVMHGPTLQTYPTDEELLDLCQKTGKLPLDFMAPPMIEETTPWHSTTYANDFYPTLAVAFQSAGQRAGFIADFDTGASDTYVDATINPNRTALVGRDLCLLLQPQVTLDFVQHQTTVGW